MTAYRNTYIPPRPQMWPFPLTAVTALLLVMGAVLLSAPALYLLAWFPTIWFVTQLVRCLTWGARFMGDIEGAFR